MKEYISFVTTITYGDGNRTNYECEDYTSALGYYTSGVRDINVHFVSISHTSGKLLKFFEKSIDGVNLK